MTTDFYQRGAVLIGLAVISIGLALAGNAIGIGDATTTSASPGEVTIAEDEITLSDGEQELTPVENLTGVQQVDITDERGTVNITTTNTSTPLNTETRELAREIALTNETIQQYISTVDTYDIAVEPIRRVDSGDIQSTSVNMSTASSKTSENGTETVSFTAAETDTADSVTVTRTPRYDREDVTVRIAGPEGQLQYSLTVDLSEKRIVAFTDWNDGSSDS